MPVFLRRWHGDIPTSPRINLFQQILLIGDGSAAQTTFGCYLFRVAYKLADGRNDAIRQIGVSEVTYYRWRQEFGGAAHPVGRPGGRNPIASGTIQDPPLRPGNYGSISGQLTFPRYTLMRFVHALDAIFELTAVVRKLLIHLIDTPRHVPPDRTHVHFSPLSQHYRADSSLRRRLQRSVHWWLLPAFSLPLFCAPPC